MHLLCLKPLSFLGSFPGHFARTRLGASSRLVFTLRTITFRFVRFEKPKLAPKALFSIRLACMDSTRSCSRSCTLGQKLNEWLLVE